MVCAGTVPTAKSARPTDGATACPIAHRGFVATMGVGASAAYASQEVNASQGNAHVLALLVTRCAMLYAETRTTMRITVAIAPRNALAKSPVLTATASVQLGKLVRGDVSIRPVIKITAVDVVAHVTVLPALSAGVRLVIALNNRLLRVVAMMRTATMGILARLTPVTAIQEYASVLRLPDAAWVIPTALATMFVGHARAI